MRQFTILLVLMALGCGCSKFVRCSPLSSPPKPVGMITGLTGTVTIKASGMSKDQPARLMMLVKSDDLLTVAKKANAVVVFFANSHREQLAAMSAARISSAGCTMIKGVKHTLPPLPGGGKVIQTASTGDNQEIGGILIRGGPDGFAQDISALLVREDCEKRLYLLTPTETTFITTTPFFAWNAIKGAQKYLVTLLDNHGAAIWQKSAGSNCYLRFPLNATPLEPGNQYVWTVRAMKDDTILTEATLTFTLAAEADYAKVRASVATLSKVPSAPRADYSEALWQAAYYQNNQLPSEAIQIYQQLAVLCPKDRAIHNVLFYLYTTMKVEDDAGYEYWLIHSGRVN